MVSSRRPKGDASGEVDQILLNARLRDELEPFLDEAVSIVNSRDMPTSQENEYLASMLAWERAPVLPIADWFEPRLGLPHPDALTSTELHNVLRDAITQLYDKHIVLDFTDHLPDRALYCLILRDILPSPEKRLKLTSTYLHWHCLDPTDEPDTWLRYYASDDEREAWSEQTGEELVPAEIPPYKRKMPRRKP